MGSGGRNWYHFDDLVLVEELEKHYTTTLHKDRFIFIRSPNALQLVTLVRDS
jgi:hypothetical protein